MRMHPCWHSLPHSPPTIRRSCLRVDCAGVHISSIHGSPGAAARHRQQLGAEVEAVLYAQPAVFVVAGTEQGAINSYCAHMLRNHRH